MKVPMSITVHGTTEDFVFMTEGDPKNLDEYWAQGIEIYEVVNSIPEFIAWLGLTRVWCWLQNMGVIKL